MFCETRLRTLLLERQNAGSTKGLSTSESMGLEVAPDKRPASAVRVKGVGAARISAARYKRNRISQKKVRVMPEFQL